MGLFDMFGKGGGDLTVELTQTSFAVHDIVRGTAVFTAGKREQKIEGLQVWFTNGETVLGMSGPKKIPLTDSIKPGEVKRYAFEIEVPNYSTHTLNGVSASNSFALRASLDIPKEIDPQGKAVVHLSGGIVAAVTTGGGPKMER